MAELKRFLYRNLTYTINTGFKKLIVRNDILRARVNVPHIVWKLDFGDVPEDVKSAIENIIITDPNNTYIESNIGPNFTITKRQDPIQGNAYYLTYNFEYEYYNNFVLRPLSYTNRNGIDYITEDVFFPDNMDSSSTPIVFKPSVALPRRLFHLDTKVVISHNAFKVYNLKMNFTEQASEAYFSDLFIVGASDVNYTAYC